jgi:hypothetical protein
MSKIRSVGTHRLSETVILMSLLIALSIERLDPASNVGSETDLPYNLLKALSAASM